MTHVRRVLPLAVLALVLGTLVRCREIQGVSIDREDAADGAPSTPLDAALEAAQPDTALGKKPCGNNCITSPDAGGRAVCNEFGATQDYDCREGTVCCLDTRACAAVGGTCLDLLPPGGCGQFGPPGACPRDTSASTCCIGPGADASSDSATD